MEKCDAFEKTVATLGVALPIVYEETGEQLYHNAFATNFGLTTLNVPAIVAAGRARWKIENENNNVLKNYGYHLEHNFGHGAEYLSMILVLLNVLAFLFHTVLDLVDEVYQRLRTHLHVRDFFHRPTGFDPLHVLRKLGSVAQLYVCTTGTRPARNEPQTQILAEPRPSSASLGWQTAYACRSDPPSRRHPSRRSPISAQFSDKHLVTALNFEFRRKTSAWIARLTFMPHST